MSAGGALERRIKRVVYGLPHVARIIPGPGFSSVVEAEVAALIPELFSPSRYSPLLSRTDGGILVDQIDFRSLCELTLRLLSPADIRLGLYTGKVTGKDELLRALAKVPFDLYLPPGADVSIRAESGKSRLYHEGLIEELAVEGLARGGWKVSLNSPFRLFLTLFENVLAVEISLAGEPLWKRGYRSELKAAAPLREDLAQSAIRTAAAFHAGNHTRFDFQTLFIPFCGTGTFLFESLMRRWELSSLLFGRSFAVERFVCAPADSLRWIGSRVRARAMEIIAGDLPITGNQPEGRREPRLILIDRDKRAVDTAGMNADRFFSCLAGAPEAPGAESAVSDRSHIPRAPLEIICADAFANPWSGILPADPGTVFLPLNPPYGKRLQDSSGLFLEIGRQTSRLAGAVVKSGGSLFGFILCPDEDSRQEFLSAAGGPALKTVHFSQGGLDVRLVLFSYGHMSIAS